MLGLAEGTLGFLPPGFGRSMTSTGKGSPIDCVALLQIGRGLRPVIKFAERSMPSLCMRIKDTVITDQYKLMHGICMAAILFQMIGNSVATITKGGLEQCTPVKLNQCMQRHSELCIWCSSLKSQGITLLGIFGNRILGLSY